MKRPLRFTCCEIRNRADPHAEPRIVFDLNHRLDIAVEPVSIEQLRKDVFYLHNTQPPSTGKYPEFPDPITVNYVRDFLTRITMFGEKFSYDSLSRMCSDSKTRRLLENHVLQEIGEVYSELDEETKRQIVANRLWLDLRAVPVSAPRRHRRQTCVHRTIAQRCHRLL